MTVEAPRSRTVAESAADFPVAWEDPADAERTWVWAGDHAPLPLTPLSADFARISWDAMQTIEQRGLRPHERGVAAFLNGYLYTLRRPRPDPQEPPAPPDPVAEERTRRHEALAARLVDAWRGEIEPEIRSLCRRVRDRAYEALSAAEIADLLESCFADAAHAFALTHVATDGMSAAVRPLVAFIKETFPAENADALAGEMTGGYANYTASSENGAWRLARLAERVPAVREVLLTRADGDVTAVLHHLPEAASFRRAVETYVELYGWRPEMWWELTFPVWAEDPAPLYEMVRYYLRHPGADPRRAQRRAAERRRNAVNRTRMRLRADPERLARFGALLPIAQQYVPVREDRALWQLATTGVARVPCLALGRKLHAAGTLDAPDDVFYLYLDELRRLAHIGRVGYTDELDHRALVAERRADRQRRLTTVPPIVIGRLDPARREEIGAQLGRFAELGFEEERGGSTGQTPILRGGAASRGVVHARARVVLALAEGDKLAPGEVLVCRTTSPSWTPLVARAGAVVADTGGILAHCAIVAREHAIPCVVGTGMATTSIRDGMLVTVDGTQGVVRLDGDGTEHTAGVASPVPPGARVDAHGRPREAAAATATTAPPPAGDPPGTRQLVAWLGEVACHETLLTGGKAANLSRLAAAFRVPPGFCVTAAAYELAHGAGGAVPGGAESLPAVLRAELGAAYAQLAERCGVPAPAVAVRSSAIDEDGAAASFAGQHETILNVAGEDALLDAVMRCWRSLHTAGALVYRASRGLSTDGVRLAVLVQQLVPADAAGVLFTANPVTGNRDEALLTASYGLGESIVGGSVTPDTYVVRKSGPGGPHVVSVEVGTKDVMTVLAPPGEAGTREVPVTEALRQRRALADVDVLEAARLGMALEHEMGWPVDVECAWKGGVLYLLQCRPITTLR